MDPLKCFVIMPFQREFDPVFAVVRDAARNAVPGMEIECSWLKDVHAAGRITDDILDELQHASLCVADVTNCNPNVMWETGYAMALGHPAILISQDIEKLPFDLKVHRVLGYSAASPEVLGPKLSEAIRQTLARYELPSAPPAGPVANRTIAITGSMRADRAALARRIATLIGPFLGTGSVWYCGSSGVTDEQVLAYLVAAGERVFAVGYQRYDLSEAVRRIVESGKAGFIDASVESVPKGMAGPTRRDEYFCAKADLVILLWSASSAGTGELISYFLQMGRSLLVGVV